MIILIIRTSKKSSIYAILIVGDIGNKAQNGTSLIFYVFDYSFFEIVTTATLMKSLICSAIVLKYIRNWAQNACDKVT